MTSSDIACKTGRRILPILAIIGILAVALAACGGETVSDGDFCIIARAKNQQILDQYERVSTLFEAANALNIDQVIRQAQPETEKLDTLAYELKNLPEPEDPGDFGQYAGELALEADYLRIGVDAYLRDRGADDIQFIVRHRESYEHWSGLTTLMIIAVCLRAQESVDATREAGGSTSIATTRPTTAVPAMSRTVFATDLIRIVDRIRGQFPYHDTVIIDDHHYSDAYVSDDSLTTVTLSYRDGQLYEIRADTELMAVSDHLYTPPISHLSSVIEAALPGWSESEQWIIENRLTAQNNQPVATERDGLTIDLVGEPGTRDLSVVIADKSAAP